MADGVFPVHVKNIRTGAEVVQVLHSWGQRVLCLQRAGEPSLSGSARGPAGLALFICPLEVLVPFHVPGAGVNVSLP